MEYSNSSLATFIMPSPNYDKRDRAITKITPHHAACVNASLSGMGNVFRTRACSANYGIDSEGNIAMYVSEDKRAWTSCSAENDYSAVTIEVANSSGDPDWKISDKAWNALVKLCVDICKRNNIPKLEYTGDKYGSLTRHNMFVATSCPGPYLQGRFPELANAVNIRLKNGAEIQEEPEVVTIYRVQVGAYAVEENAVKMKNKLVLDGYSTYLVQTDGLWKVQVGAYKLIANAERMAQELQEKGYPTYTTNKTASVIDRSVKVGSKVRIKAGALTYTQGGLAPYVYDRTYTVSQLNGDRAVITYNGVVVAAMHKDDLYLA